MNCWVWLLDSDKVALLGLTDMEETVLLLTVTRAVAVTLPDLAVMVEFPNATPVTSPPVSTVAMLVAEDSQVTVDVTSPVELFPNVAVAVNCWVPVGLTKALVGDNVIAVIVSEEGKNPPQLLRRNAAKEPAKTLPKIVSRCTLITPPSGKSQPLAARKQIHAGIFAKAEQLTSA